MRGFLPSEADSKDHIFLIGLKNPFRMDHTDIMKKPAEEHMTVHSSHKPDRNVSTF